MDDRARANVIARLATIIDVIVPAAGTGRPRLWSTVVMLQAPRGGCAVPARPDRMSDVHLPSQSPRNGAFAPFLPPTRSDPGCHDRARIVS